MPPCRICGKVNYATSMGGPGICPTCDCGLPPNHGKPIFFEPHQPILPLPKEPWDVFLIARDGFIKTVFVVGPQSFTLAYWECSSDGDLEDHREGLEHCTFIQKMFLLALSNLGVNVLLRDLTLADKYESVIEEG